MLLINNLFISASLYWWINVSAVFMVGIICSSLIIPQILLVAFRKRLFDPQDERKLHRNATPRLGGIAFTPLLIFSIVLLQGINLLIGRNDIATNIQEHITELTFSLCATLLIYQTGITDDLIGVRYRAKFIVQIIGGGMLAFSGLWIDNLHGLFGLYALPPFAGYLLTVIVVVFIINATNLIDGIDGLASGLSGMALLYYGIVFMYREAYIYAFLAFALLGVIIPFFCYNVFGNPKRGRKIFMGDTGSLTLGIILSILGIKACMGPMHGSEPVNPFATAFAPLIIPCFDVLRVFLHRLRNGQAPFAPDKNHIHHKLLSAGLSQRRTLVCILAMSLSFTVVNIICARWININLLLAADIAVWTLLNIRLTQFIKNKNKKKPIKTETFTDYAN
ncbi:MraY family glycosyltransferase [Bacteroides gallinarum]|uniref:MraY family glycosyltransferase n=2 Tax=Bacteroides gallinarum TaxID=376806 RepID=UPI000365DCB8|nr:MraY family glycosyltransferase [Bacteroides gallinarum]